MASADGSAYIRELVGAAPPLSQAQLDALAGILNLSSADGTLPAPPRTLAPPARAAAEPALPDEEFIYRYFDHCGCLIYVGITNNPDVRNAQHRSGAAWYPLVASRTVRKVSDRETATSAERHAIQTESPAFNYSGRSSRQTNGQMVRYVLAHRVVPSGEDGQSEPAAAGTTAAGGSAATEEDRA